MQHPRTLPVLFSVLALLVFAGCQTVDSRIKEKPEVFASVDKTTQERIKRGIIGIDYTEDMVYLALGTPDQIRESVTTSARTVTWIYNSYTARYDSTFMMGYYGPYGYPRAYGPYRYYYPYYPLYADPYHYEKEERIRVTFNDGKVTAIDQVKD